MKVWIEAADKSPDQLGGKTLFCCRLAVALRRRGVIVSSDVKEAYDVSLNVIRLNRDVKAKHKVLRLDGVYHNTGQDYEKKNAGIKTSFKDADAIVYQSIHSMRLCDAFISKTKKPNIVIYNGSDPLFYSQIEPATDVPQSRVAVAFSKWRPHKRLKDVIESFLIANVSDSVLLIAGKLDSSGINKTDLTRYLNHPRIRYLGMLDQIQSARYLRRADMSIHLCWFDACPNSVVEAIVAGVPVISNNVGGTSELLLQAGLESNICLVDQYYNYKPVDLYNPPIIDRTIVASKIHSGFNKPLPVDATPFSIHRIAEQYHNFFESLV